MMRYLPLIVSAVAIVGVTIVNGVTTNRWSGGANAKAEACAAYLELVPMEVGPWVGAANDDVDDRIRDVAGFVGTPVSRRYTNRTTGQTVDLWLIVGHSSVIVRHTPNICYPSANFRPEEKADNHYTIKVDGEKPLETWTNLFHKRMPTGDVYMRVFWMWHCPRPGGDVQWEAPGHHVSDARDRYAGAKALFKMYFTCPARAGDNPDDSVAKEFANDFIPALNELLAGAAEGKPPTQQTATAATADADEAPPAA